jgi:hypothetical protein
MTAASSMWINFGSIIKIICLKRDTKVISLLNFTHRKIRKNHRNLSIYSDKELSDRL